ncbi:MAG TPA: 7-cyano-7-deazaguanine synthase [Gemmataceae bacterium]|nr:7-cyano-7-deazaguanine synthase [Gemmataceae bacterium]
MTATLTSTENTWRHQAVAALVSGGPDSAILVAELARDSPRVVPIYVRFGMIWEDEEEDALRHFLRALAAPAMAPLKVFQLPIASVYGPHWSLTGNQVPGADSPDAAVFLPGRNLLLLAQASVWCHLQQIDTIAMGLLKGNPFADSSDAFFAGVEATVKAALGSKLHIVRPYRDLTKNQVLQRGRSLPLGLTWSCMQPVRGIHCGRCNKCAERQKAFADAGIHDPTRYA